MSTKRSGYLSSLAFLLVAFVSVPVALQAAGAQAAGTSEDSQKISALLSQARQEASQLQREASEMESFARSKQLTRQCHLFQLTAVKEQANKMLGTVEKLDKARATGSARQQEAIDRIKPAVHLLAASIQATFDHLKDDPGETETSLCSQYKEYVTTIAELATKTAKVVGEVR